MRRCLQVFNWSVRLLTWRRDADRYTTDLVLGVAEPVIAIREGFFTSWR
jgi:hypothetical protein